MINYSFTVKVTLLMSSAIPVNSYSPETFQDKILFYFVTHFVCDFFLFFFFFKQLLYNKDTQFLVNLHV